MSNLPPGVTASDIDDHYGSSVPDHEHSWRPEEDEPFILEDGAAIFHFYCDWQETKAVDLGHRGTEYHGVGPECGEETFVRLETNADADTVETIQQAYMDNDITVESIDPPIPDEHRGSLVVSGNGVTVRYA